MIMETLRTRTCEKCRYPVPISKIKLFPRSENRNWVLCPRCYENLKRKKAEEKARLESSTPRIREKINKVSFVCSRCNYVFKIDENKARSSIVCPYCGKDDKILLKE